MGNILLSASQARRIALGAQGFADRRPTGRVDRRHLRRALDRMGVIQIDSVNVLVRSQELPLFARLGPHPRTLIDDASADGELFEYWVHEACHVPAEHHQLYRWRMRSPHRWGAFRSLMADRAEFVEQVYDHVAEHGPIVAGDLRQRVGKKGAWWDYDDGKIALEALFHEGRIGARAAARTISPGCTTSPSGRSRPTSSSARLRPNTTPARSCWCWPPDTTVWRRWWSWPTTTARAIHRFGR